MSSLDLLRRYASHKMCMGLCSTACLVHGHLPPSVAELMHVVCCCCSSSCGCCCRRRFARSLTTDSSLLSLSWEPPTLAMSPALASTPSLSCSTPSTLPLPSTFARFSYSLSLRTHVCLRLL